MIAVEELLERGTRRPFAYGTSHRVEEIDVVLDDGTRVALIVKEVGRDGLLEEARRAKPGFLADSAREVAVYSGLLATSDLGTPAFYGAVTGERTLLVLEKVAGVELWQVRELDAWLDAARWLARMHVTLADRAAEPYLLRLDAPYYRRWLTRARAQTRALDHVAARYDEVVERLLALPTVVIHGEFYASNILVSGSRVCPVDWEMAGAGPGLIDLAALTAGWGEHEQAAIVDAYGEVSAEALDCCRLHLALQWLGWSPGWSPPPEHARDWLAEALGAADRLGL